MRRGDLYVLSLSHLTDDVYQGALPAMLPFLVADRGFDLRGGRGERYRRRHLPSG